MHTMDEDVGNTLERHMQYFFSQTSSLCRYEKNIQLGIMLQLSRIFYMQ